jgi:hypothetical protein
MKIESILSQHRRDFHALYKCEGCGHVVNGCGYDDDNFHQHVIPAMKCQSCGKSALELGVEIRPLRTKYPADAVV